VDKTQKLSTYPLFAKSYPHAFWGAVKTGAAGIFKKKLRLFSRKKKSLKNIHG